MSSTPVIPAVPYGQPPTPSVPGGTSVTPPPGSFTQGDQPQIGQQPVPGGGQDPEQIKKLLSAVLAKQSQPQLAAPVPSPIPEPKQQSQTGSGPGWGFERFANQIGGQIQNAVANQKKAQLAKAESDWGQFSTAVQTGKGELWLAQNEKAAKNMAKALNQDWLNPEKTNVYRQALDNYTKQQQAKGKAASGLQSLMKKLIGKAQNPQLTDQQKQAIAQEQMSKAPTGTGLDSKSMIDLYRAVGEEAYRGKSLGLEQQRVDIDKQQADTAQKRTAIEDKRYSEDLKFKYDQLASQQADRAAALDEKKSSDQERMLALQSTLDLRKQMIDISKQRLESSMAGAGTPKERQTEWKNLFDDLDKRRAGDNQILGKAGTIASLTGEKSKLQDVVERDNAASAVARKLQSDVIAGRIDPIEAKNKVYSVYDQNTKIFPMSQVRALALQNKVPVADLQKSLESKGAVVY